MNIFTAMRFIKKLLPFVVVAVAAQASAQVLYKVEGNGLAAPSYIFGTHHLAPLSVIDKFGVKVPFESTVQVVGEIDMTQSPMVLAQAMQPHMMSPVDSTLSKVIAPDVFDKINEEFKKFAPMRGMDLTGLEPLKPMAVSSMMLAPLFKQIIPEYNPAEQLDTWFQTTGLSEGKRIVALETMEQQAAILFDVMPIAMQADELVEMLLDTPKTLALAKEMTDAYMAQDLDKIIAVNDKEKSAPEFEKALLDNRNADWLTKLPAIFKDGSTFVAVGVLHLAGEKGIIQGLRNLGYTVTPIKN